LPICGLEQKSAGTCLQLVGAPREMLARGCWLAALVAMTVGGCSYEHALGVDHYSVFKVDPPHGSTVSVCSAYGCRKQTKFTFSQADLAEIKKLMEKTKKADTPYEERRAIAYAIGWMERRTGEVVGTKADQDRKSTRLNSSHVKISYAVFCLKKKKHNEIAT